MGKIYIGNLPFTATDTDVRTLFADFGTIHSLRLAIDEKGVSRGFGFVEMDNADEVIQELDDVEFEGLNLVVKQAVERGNW